MDNDTILSIMANTETSRQELGRYYFCPRTDCAQNFCQCVKVQRSGKCSQTDEAKQSEAKP